MTELHLAAWPCSYFEIDAGGIHERGYKLPVPPFSTSPSAAASSDESQSEMRVVRFENGACNSPTLVDLRSTPDTTRCLKSSNNS